MTHHGLRVNGPLLKQKSEEFAMKLGTNDFNPSEGWLNRWKKRNNIKFKRAHGEKASAGYEGASNWEKIVHS